MIDFDALSRTEFSWRSALSLCHASQLVYEGPATVVETARAWGFDDVKTFESDDTQAFFADKGQIAVVSYRGTESFGDWITNIQLITEERDYGDVHGGFFDAFKEVDREVRAAIDGGGYSHLYVTGHSLGGALATIALIEYAGMGIQNKVGYTYGQPRTGKSNFRRSFDEAHAANFYRVFNKKDIVPRVPPGFRHVGTAKRLTEDGGLESVGLEAADDAAPEITEKEFSVLQDGIESLVAAAQAAAQAEADGLESVPLADEALEGFLPGVKAHALDLYIERLEALAE